MTPEQKNLMQQHLIILGIAPAEPIPENYAFRAVNLYSKQDFITGGFAAPYIPMGIICGNIGANIGKSFFGNEDCDIRFIPCISKAKEKTGRFADHAFLGETYKIAIQDSIRSYKRNFGFYNGKTR